MNANCENYHEEHLSLRLIAPLEVHEQIAADGRQATTE